MKNLRPSLSRVLKRLLGSSLIAASCLTSVFADPILSDSGHSAIDLTEDVWYFELDDIEGAEAVDFDVSYWHRVSIPHTWNALDAQDGEPRASELRPAGYRLAVGWYRQVVRIPEDYAGQRTFIRFEGASVVKNLYVNGRHVGQHKGAFAAFCFEITDYVKPGESATIAVRVDNTRRQGRDPREQKLTFNLKQLDIAPLKGDFNLYGGIYRGVELLTKPPVHISPTDYASSGVYVDQTEVSQDFALLNIETVVSGTAGAEPAELIAELFDADGQRVATAQGRIVAEASSRHDLELKVDAPRLWNGIADPYRYTLKVRVTASNGLSDEVVQKIGIRSLVYERGIGFVLNGEPIRLRGVNRHQDWEDRGWALTRHHHEIDFNMIKEIGSNAVRLAHYPQDAYVLELCDRLGLITFIEIPWVGLTYDNEAFGENLKRQLREMIRQHYNRASIPMWGLWNELLHGAPADTPNPMPLLRELNAIVHEEDPLRRSIGAASDGSSAVEGLRDVTDLLSWNLYPGWYGDSQPDEMTAWIDERIAADQRDLIGISEYGAGASIYHHEDWSTLSKPKASDPWHPEEWQAYFHERTWAAIAASDKLWGSFVWNMFDFAADHRDEGDREGINDKGLVTHDRKVKKDAFFFYKASWTDEPVLHITSRRYSPRPAGKATIKVYSNLSDLKLRLNGVSMGPGQQDGVVFVWDDVALEPGTAQVEVKAMHEEQLKTDRIDWEIAPPVRYATLKFDDMRPEEGVDGVTAVEQQVYETLRARGMPHAWGVCRLYQSDNPSFYAWLKARDAEGIEIWHHGNRHDRIKGESWEFKNRSLDSQQANFAYTQNRVFEKTGIVLETFGAPYNQTDANTAEVLNASDAIKTMYFAQGSPGFEGMQLNHRVNLESKTGVVASLDAFKASYAEQADAEMIVLQAHPVYWDAPQALPKLQAILDFLKAEGRVFITPKDYGRLKKAK